MSTLPHTTRMWRGGGRRSMPPDVFWVLPMPESANITTRPSVPCHKHPTCRLPRTWSTECRTSDSTLEDHTRGQRQVRATQRAVREGRGGASAEPVVVQPRFCKFLG